MKKLILCMLLLAGSAAFAQKATAFGTVLDSQGKPVKGATVTVTVDGTSITLNLTTNKKGKFTALKLAFKPITVVVSKDGYQTKTYKYEQKEARETVKIQLLAVGKTLADVADRPALTGTVVGSNGKPIAGVNLKFTIEGLPEYKVEATTDDQGKFVGDGVPNNIVEIYAIKADYRDQIYKVRMQDEPVDIEDFTMQTLDEAYEELGLDKPGKRTPKEMAIDIYNQAVAPYNQQQWVQAEQLAKKAFELDPTEPKTLQILIWCNQKQEDWKEVLSYGDVYMKLVPDNQNINKVVMFAAEALGDTAKLTELKAQLRASGAISVTDIFNEAVASINAGDDPKAFKLLDEAETVDPNFARIYLEKGKIKTREFEFDDAVKYLKKYLKLADKDDKYRKEAEDLIVMLLE